MADRHVEHLLIGGGPAAVSCAAALRAEGAEGEVLIVGRELDAPYERPPASKEYLRGEVERADTLLRPPEWWGQQGVELLTRTSAMKLDLGDRVATLSTKESVAFDTALIATGALVRRINVDGSDLDGIHYLRTLPNTDAIRRDLAEAERVVLIGGSWIGCEVAASLTALGHRCTIVMQEATTFERFGGRAAGFFHGLLESRGIEIVGEDSLGRLEGADERVTKVVTERGTEIAADLVIIGAGVLPDVMLARGAGLELGLTGGVMCDSRLQTLIPGIYAAGDMCEYESPLHDGARRRFEHWDVAQRQGETVAANMLGANRPHDVVPYFFSDLADWASMEYAGLSIPWDEEIVRGSIDDGRFTLWHLSDGRLTGAIAVGRSEDLEGATALITSRTDVSAAGAALTDPGVDVATLV